MTSLTELAEAYGVASDYWDQAGTHHEVDPATTVAILRSLGAKAGSPAEIDASMRELHLRDWRRMLPPVFIHRQWAEGSIWAHVPHGDPVVVELELESGTATMQLQQIDDWTPPHEVPQPDGSVVLTGQASFRVPSGLPLGWHSVRATSGDTTGTTPLVVTPDRLPDAPSGWGLMAQLYSLRSFHSWGVGDLYDLTSLATASAHEGAQFLLVNPLHAAQVEPPMTPSPYLPATRRFFNPMYLAVTDIPEFSALDGDSMGAVLSEGSGVQQANTTADLLDRDATWAAKRRALEIIAAVPLSPSRADLFSAYCDAEGLGLLQFATWCALCEKHGNDWRDWPQDLRDPGGEGVPAAQEELADRVRFYQWCQWQLDQQLEAAQGAAERAGMSIGILHDLAVGVHLDGADSWRLQDVLARGVTVGAPPDMFNQQGQNWDQPPWRPIELAEQAFIPYRDMLRTILRHAGGIRVDHVLGLFRQWWIPRGSSAATGTYVRMDHEALVGILALEAHRAGAVLIGEDLGTLEGWIQESLNGRGILGVGILWFQNAGEEILPPDRWRPQELASVTVHDLPPTGAFLRGEHIRLRDELGLLTRSTQQEYREHRRDALAWLSVAQGRGAAAPRDVAAISVDLETLANGGEVDWGDPGRTDLVARLVVALHGVLRSGPSTLRGVHIPDLTGDRRAQNQPGTDQEYPNWNVPLTDDAGDPVLLDDLWVGDLARSILREMD